MHILLNEFKLFIYIQFITNIDISIKIDDLSSIFPSIVQYSQLEK